MTDPAPFDWFRETQRRRAEDLRTDAAAIRRSVAAVAERLVTLRAYDRLDVWQGEVANRSRATRAEALRRLASPTSGALASLVDAAARLDARAAAHEAAEPIAPGTVACTPLDQLTPPWRPAPTCGR